MQAQFETTAAIPATQEGYVFAEVDVLVTVQGQIEGINERNQREWDYSIVSIEGHALKSLRENGYETIPTSNPLYAILLASLEKDPSLREQAEEALTEAYYDALRAAE